MKNLLIQLCIWSIIPITQAQNTFFVSNNGDNNNSGAINSPWKSIQHGMNNLSPGDILNIRGGRYFEKLQINNSGTEYNQITIKAYENENVIVDGDVFNDNRAMFFSYEKNYFTVEGIHFTNCYNLNGGGGFTVYSTGKGINLINCTFSNIAISRDINKIPTYTTNQPVVTFIGTHPTDPIENILVNGIEIYNCRPGYSECLSISGNAENFEFSNNYIHNNANIGIDAIGNYGYCPTKDLDQARKGIIKNNVCHDNRSPVAASAGIYIDGAKNIIIENNVLFNNDYGAEIGCEESGEASHIIFRNNIVYNNHMAGIALGGYSSATGGKVTHSKIVNNTFYNNDIDNKMLGELFISQLENSEISNNIFYLSHQNHLMTNYRDQPNLKITYNLIYNDEGEHKITSFWDNKTLNGVNSIDYNTNMGNNNFYNNPKFNDISSMDFRLKSDSKAIDGGNPNYKPEHGELDMNKESRLYNAIVDCGADEVHTLSITNNLKKQPIKVYPNPTNNKVSIKGELLEDKTIELIDNTGKIIFRKKNLTSFHTINLEKLPPSLYFMKIKNNRNKTIKNHKIIKY